MGINNLNELNVIPIILIRCCPGMLLMHRVKFTSIHHLVLSTLTGFTSQYIVLDFILFLFLYRFLGNILGHWCRSMFFVTCSCKCCNNFTDCDIFNFVFNMSNYVLCTMVIIFYVKVQGLKKKLR